MSQVKVTSAEVAALAGVSQSAVSRVFTPGASASAKTALKVRQAAVKLGYRPNSIARAMVSGKSRIIGLVVAYLENQFYPEALEKLSAMLQDRGYHVLIFMANTATDNLDEILGEILDYQVDGIVAASVALSSQLLDRCQNAGGPGGLVQPQPRFTILVLRHLGQYPRRSKSRRISIGHGAKSHRLYCRLGGSLDAARPGIWLSPKARRVWARHRCAHHWQFSYGQRPASHAGDV